MILRTVGSIPETARPAASLLEKHGYSVDGSREIAVKFIEADDKDTVFYRIAAQNGAITVTASTACSFNAAVGYILRNIHNGISDAEVKLGSAFRGSTLRRSTLRDNSFRSVYFANHFHNYYHAAPIDALCEYLEELALYGMSVLSLWFDMHHFTSLDDENAHDMLCRMKALYKKARELGMKTALTHLANEYYSLSPDELKACNEAENGYRSKPGGFYHTELCPSKPEGERLILNALDRLLENLSDVGLDYIMLWPYDQGGCTCDKCAPWGANGFLRLSERSAEIARSRFPDIKIVLSCWRFDIFTDKEWHGLIPKLNESFFADALMVDIGAYIPDELFESAQKVGIDVLSFPEISMHGAVPWGGFGANPYPAMLKAQFDTFKGKIGGCSLYSEGIFEDINKAVCLSLACTPDRDVRDILREYCAYHFGEKAADALCGIIMRLEATLPRSAIDADGNSANYPHKKPTALYRYIIKKPDDVDAIRDEFKMAEKSVSESAKASWRYKILRARVMGDSALLENGGFPGDETDEIFTELVKLFYAENAYYFVSPITKESIFANRGEGV